jgi:hypothetical protein
MRETEFHGACDVHDPLYKLRMTDERNGAPVEWESAGETKISEKPRTNATLSIQTPTWTDLWLSPGRRDENQVTNVRALYISFDAKRIFPLSFIQRL